MPRELNTATLDAAAKHYAAEFLRPDAPSARDNGKFVGGRAYVRQDFFAFDFKDEFEYLLSKIRGQLGPDALNEFDAMAAETFTPRSDEVFEKVLAEKLAINPDGDHIPGRIGTVHKDGTRFIKKHLIEAETVESVQRRKRMGLGKEARQTEQRMVPLYWPIYAGETEERLADSGVADPLPEGTPGLSVGALNTRIANVIALKACDIIVDELDTGSVDGFLDGRSGAQPADPDTAISGTRLFALDLGTPAFGAAVDGTPGGLATANAISDDTSADATGTLGYIRAASANVALTSLDDLIDGEAGTSGADFNFNTLAIVSGATVSMTSWTVTMPES